MLGIHRHKLTAKSLSKWLRNHQGIVAIVLGVLGLLLATLMVVFVLKYNSPKLADAPVKHAIKPSPKPEAPKFYSPLTGNPVPDEASTKQAVTGIMIENSPDARPQSGLKDAGVVFEAIAEGGITRFLALYQEAKPQLIGPVRSVRLYFVDWLTAFDASIAHVGGSAHALSLVRNGSYRDIDQFFNGAYYWRATDRYAPHNVYTSFDRLDALNNKKGFTSSTFTSWTRVDGKASTKPDASQIDVKVSSPLFNSHYDYDVTTNTYIRSEGGKKHLDREGGEIRPSVVVTLNTEMYAIQEDGTREQIRTTGSGVAHIFQNGIVTTATWTKPDIGSQIAFTDASGAPIKLNRGQMWITAVPTNTGGKVSWQ